MKEGKSDVVCDLRGDRGQLIKVSKDKNGRGENRYMSRKEIIKVAKDIDRSGQPARA